MKIRKGQRHVRYGPGDLKRAMIVDKDCMVCLHIIPIEHMEELPVVVPGMPHAIAQITPGKALLYPVPDHSYDVRLTWAEYHEK